MHAFERDGTPTMGALIHHTKIASISVQNKPNNSAVMNPHLSRYGPLVLPLTERCTFWECHPSPGHE